MPHSAEPAGAPAGKIRVMSGAAIEPGLLAAADTFRARTGIEVEIDFATAPQVRQRIGAGERPEVLITTPAVLDDLTRSGTIDAAARISVGRVGIGVTVREGAPQPDISTIEALKRALREADAVIYNRASSGLFVEGLIERLGLTAALRSKTKRYSGTDMAEPLIRGSGKEIGFMPIAEILHFESRGMRLVGPLPAAIQHYTEYVAVPLSNAAAALAFFRFLAHPKTGRIFAAAGIEPRAGER